MSFDNIILVLGLLSESRVIAMASWCHVCDRTCDRLLLGVVGIIATNLHLELDDILFRCLASRLGITTYSQYILIFILYKLAPQKTNAIRQ